MADLYKNTGLPLYSPATHLLRFCSMPVSYKRSITTKKEEAKVYLRKGFITPSVPFAERWFIKMKIAVITVGKIKEKYLRDAIAEYSKRLSRYCKLEVIEVADEKTPDQASETVEDNIRAKEGERLMKHIRDDMYVITLEIGGKMFSSEEFAEKIETLGVQGKSSIAFVIGGSIGLGKDVLKRSDFALSFSKMTFPHQLMRVILLEQVYRVYRIMNGEPYHK